MQNLKKGDFVLLTRVSEKDVNVPQYLENVWTKFKGYTKTGKIEVLAPARRKIKEKGLKEHEWMKSRVVHLENIKAIARKNKNK